MLADTHEVKRSKHATEVFHQALDVMSEGVGTSDIFEEMRNNPMPVLAGKKGRRTPDE